MKVRNYLITVLSIFSLTFLVTSCGSSSKELTDYELMMKEQEFYRAVDSLNEELQTKAISEEYYKIDGEGKELNPAEVLDYKELIQIMDVLEPYCYFTLLDAFLEERGYTPEDFVEAHTLFFSLSDDDKAQVLSCMFRNLGETAIEGDATVETTVEIFILRAFSLIDKTSGVDIPKNDG